MQDFFFVGLIGAVALGVALLKTIMFVIQNLNLKQTNEIIDRNLSQIKVLSTQSDGLEAEKSEAFDPVANWRLEDPRISQSQDLRLQFLAKTKTRRGPSGAAERMPLATSDFGNDFYHQEASDSNSVPIYTYNQDRGETQV